MEYDPFEIYCASEYGCHTKYSGKFEKCNGGRLSLCEKNTTTPPKKALLQGVSRLSVWFSLPRCPSLCHVTRSLVKVYKWASQVVVSKIFLIFTPILGEDAPNFDLRIFFRWVGKNHHLASANFLNVQTGHGNLEHP